MDIARELAMMGIRGAEGEFDRYLRQLDLEGGALTRGRQMGWNELSNLLGFSQSGLDRDRQYTLQQFQSMAPYMFMTQAEKAAHVRGLLQTMGVPGVGALTEEELEELFDSIVGGGQ